MRRRSTPDQLAIAGVAALALICAWRWWGVPSRATELAWRGPQSCDEVYRVRVDETYRDESVAAFVGREEEHSQWLLALGRRGDQTIAVLVREDQEDDVRRRELSWSATEVGPAAPDFACRRRGWDPIEDALALGWPKLPGAKVRIGDAWLGATVEGRCHETVCASEQGKFEHDRRCRARPWRERLSEVEVEAGVAVIVSEWDDGHVPPVGVLTSRTCAIHEGRPLWVSASVEHRWSGVHRELELTRIDDCSGESRATPEDAAAVARARAQLRASGP